MKDTISSFNQTISIFISQILDSTIGHVISANHLAISMHHTKVVGPGPHHCSLLDLILC